jgi:hypothetical protein
VCVCVCMRARVRVRKRMLSSLRTLVRVLARCEHACAGGSRKFVGCACSCVDMLPIIVGTRLRLKLVHAIRISRITMCSLCIRA